MSHQLLVMKERVQPACYPLIILVLVVALTVIERSIEDVGAAPQRPVDGGDAFIVVLGAVASQHAHATEAHGRHHEVRRPELDVFHGSIPPDRSPEPGPRGALICPKPSLFGTGAKAGVRGAGPIPAALELRRRER